MAPKRPARAAVGSVVRTTRRLVQETIGVSVVQEKDVAAKEKKVVEVEVEEKTGKQPPEAAPPAVKGEEEVPTSQPPMPAAEEKQPSEMEEKESEEEETQPPLESKQSDQRGQEKQHVEGEVRGGEERQEAVEANGGLKGDKQPVEEEEEEKKAAEGKMEGKEGEEGEEKGKKGRGRRRPHRRKVGGEAGGGAGGGRGYKRYVFRVLKQVHPELRVSSMAMTVLDNLMKDMFERIVDEATRLSKYSCKATLSSREIQGAVRLVLPGELGKHAVAEGAKAVANYMAAENAGV